MLGTVPAVAPSAGMQLRWQKGSLAVCGHPAPVPSSQSLRSSLWNLLYSSGKPSLVSGVRALLGCPPWTLESCSEVVLV